jgi:hypothetical protein
MGVGPSAASPSASGPVAGGKSCGGEPPGSGVQALLTAGVRWAGPAQKRFRTRDEFETDIAQTPRKTGHHPGPEDKASQQDRQLREICKTSIPGSNPGGASNFSGARFDHRCLGCASGRLAIGLRRTTISGLSPRAAAVNRECVDCWRRREGRRFTEPRPQPRLPPGCGATRSAGRGDTSSVTQPIACDVSGPPPRFVAPRCA